MFLQPVAVVCCTLCGLQETPQTKPPLSPAETSAIRDRQLKIVATATQAIEKSDDDVGAYSTRADALFFLGRFKEAAADYDRMVKLSPSLDASHWRRGIAWFYAGDFRNAAGQFERYHSFDNVDRENGIWRYLCQHKARGRKHARQGLLKYEKDDREPFPAVYKLFAGTITPEAIRKQIDAARLSATERDKRVFYAELYIGLNELVEGRTLSAERHLAEAVRTKWPRTAGFGPNYMWHVGRVQYDLLVKQRKAKKQPQDRKSPKSAKPNGK